MSFYYDLSRDSSAVLVGLEIKIHREIFYPILHSFKTVMT